MVKYILSFCRKEENYTGISVLNNNTSINDLCSSLVEGIGSVLKEEVMTVSTSNEMRGRQQALQGSNNRYGRQWKCFKSTPTKDCVPQKSQQTFE